MTTTSFFANPTSRTLLIPLIVRARESEHPRGLFQDKEAQSIVANLPQEEFSFSMHPFMRIGTAVRINYFDTLTRSFLEKREHPVIVHLGCGLDTRFSRTDTGKGIHIHLDLPEVIAIRQELMPHKNERCLDWANSVLERDWMDRLEKEYKGCDFMFIVEGVLMYFQEKDVRKLIHDIAEHFPGAHLAFDTSGSASSKVINKKSAVQQMKASLLWSYDDDGNLDTWHPRLKRLERACYFNRNILRWGIWSLMHFVPPMGKSSAMYHFAITE